MGHKKKKIRKIFKASQFLQKQVLVYLILILYKMVKKLKKVVVNKVIEFKFFISNDGVGYLFY